jgi:hypothetical protein
MKRKRILLTAIVVLCLVGTALAVRGVYSVTSSGLKTNPGQLYTARNDWTRTAAITGAADATPAVGERDYATFTSSDSNNVIVAVDESWNKVRIRCTSTTDADSTVVDLFFGEGTTSTCRFHRVATLTFTTGTQVAETSGHEYADTLVPSNANWLYTAVTVNPTDNYVAEYAVDIGNVSYIGLSPTTITNAAVIEITGY